MAQELRVPGSRRDAQGIAVAPCLGPPGQPVRGSYASDPGPHARGNGRVEGSGAGFARELMATPWGLQGVDQKYCCDIGWNLEGDTRLCDKPIMS